MEQLHKIISLETYKSRYKGMLPAYKDGYFYHDRIEGNNDACDYGEMPVDTVMDSFIGKSGITKELLEHIGCVEGYTCTNNRDAKIFVGGLDSIPKDKKDASVHNYVLRYRTMVRLYSFVRDLYMDTDTKYYQYCKRGDEYIWVELTDNMWDNIFDTYSDQDDETKSLPYRKFFLFPTLPICSEYQENVKPVKDGLKLICINDKAEKFYRKFITEYEWAEIEYDDVDGLPTDEIEATIDNVFSLRYFEDEKKTKILLPKFNTECVISLLNLFEDFKNKKRSLDEEVSLNSTPYIPITLALTENIDDIGQLDGYVEEWIAFKPYWIGDKVRYNDVVYELVYDENVDWKWDAVEIDLLYYNQLKDSMALGYFTNGETLFDSEEDGLHKHFLKRPYYQGYYNPVCRFATFDHSEDNGELTSPLQHWKASEEYVEDSSAVSDTQITFKIESYVNKLKTFRKSYDDKSGEVLPFVFYDDNDSEIYDTVLQYKIGVYNITSSDGYFFGDSLDTITFVDENGENKIEYTKETCYDKDNGLMKPIFTADILKKMTGGTITFSFIKGARLNDDGSVQEKTGLVCEEGYDFEVTQYVCMATGENKCASGFTLVLLDEDDYDENDISAEFTESTSAVGIKSFAVEANYGKLCKYLGETDEDETFVKNGVYQCQGVFTYVNIGTIPNKGYLSNNDLSKLTDDSVCAGEVTYYGEQLIKDSYPDVNGFKDDSIIGIQNVKEDVDAYIERGTSSATERHNILSEVNTFEDLENYRNDYFSLKSQKQ